MHRRPPLVVVLATHRVRVAAVPGVRVGGDDPLGDLRLGEEEPVPPRGREPGVGPAQVLTDRQAVQEGDPGDDVGVVEHESQGVEAASVVAGEREPVVPQRAHGGQQVARAGALGVRGVVGRRHRLARAPVARQVRADHREPALDEQRRDPVPGRRGPRVPVQQQDRGPGAAVPDEQVEAVGRDPLLGEPLEHATQPAPSRAPARPLPREPAAVDREDLAVHVRGGG